MAPFMTQVTTKIYVKSHDHEWLALVEQEENEKGNMQK